MSSAASSAGAFLSSRATGGLPSEETKEAFRTMGDVYDSVGEGTKVVKDAVTTSVGDVVQNEMGKETRNVGGEVMGSVGDVGGTVGQVAEMGTGAALVSGGVKGAAGLAPASKPEDGPGKFTIEEKEEDDEWKDIDV
jgi:hypothetical protein